MKGWSDGKVFIAEDLLVYSLVIFGSLFADCIYNLFHAAGLVAIKHPVHLGIGQITVALTFAGLLARKIMQWQYYR